MDADSNNIGRIDPIYINRPECLIGNNRIAIVPGGCAGQYLQPPWSNNAYSERYVTWVHQMDMHLKSPKRTEEYTD